MPEGRDHSPRCNDPARGGRGGFFEQWMVVPGVEGFYFIVFSLGQPHKAAWGGICLQNSHQEIEDKAPEQPACRGRRRGSFQNVV